MSGKFSEKEIQDMLDGIKSVSAKVEFAGQNNVLDLEPHITKILKALGHPEAWVSDLSSIGDFRPIRGSYKGYIEQVSIKLGFIVNKEDLIMDIATKLKSQKELKDDSK